MATPNVVGAPYGLRPMNLVGGKPYNGSTTMYNITYGYATSIFYGDFVTVVRGDLERISVTSGVVGTLIGVFLGCTYTDPTTKQKLFSQYWPASTLAGDAMAYVSDDPDTIYKAVPCSATTVVASGARALIGQNMAMINNTGNANTGNSANAIQAPSATPATTIALPVRVVGVAVDSIVSLGTATFSSISSATITCSALPNALPIGTEVHSLAANGQIIPTASFVATAASAAATSVVLNQAPLVAIVASATLVFSKYPELLVKINHGVHKHYNGTGVA